MREAKSLLRKSLLIKRKKFFSNKFNFSHYKILKIIRKNYKLKKNISVAGYYPVNFEVNTLNILSKLSERGIIIGLPVITKNYRMMFKKWKPNQAMYLNKYGIPEPKKTNETFKPDLVLVPLVGYDEKLNRLGYGAGYYDRALKKLSAQKKIITVGIGFSFQKCSKIPVNKNDHVLDYVLNEKKMIYKKLK